MIEYMITTPISRLSKIDVLCFNDIHNIVDINVQTWLAIFGITHEQYKLLTLKNPPLDNVTKSLLYFMAKVKAKNDYLGFMRIVSNMDGFLKDFTGNEKLHYCPVCGSTDISPRAKYCSSACRQKAYRKRSS